MVRATSNLENPAISYFFIVSSSDYAALEDFEWNNLLGA
jgi:hypothetical protein